MHSPNRRQWLRSAASGAALLSLGSLTPSDSPAADQAGFTLPKLPYAFDALEGGGDVISGQRIVVSNPQRLKPGRDSFGDQLSRRERAVGFVCMRM